MFLGDVLLTPEEVDGLMANLLVSKNCAMQNASCRLAGGK